jgi:hypothetical protein
MCFLVTARQGAEPRECSVCQQKFGEASNLKRHVLSVVGAGEVVVRACDRPSDLSCVLLYIHAVRMGPGKRAEKGHARGDDVHGERCWNYLP